MRTLEAAGAGVTASWYDADAHLEVSVRGRPPTSCAGVAMEVTSGRSASRNDRPSAG